MSVPQIFYDPTSEPCRAIHWLCLEANLPYELKYVWLTRDEHFSDALLSVNPHHQVPALQHDNFCLSETAAIMNYLTDTNNCSSSWFGNDIESRARINRCLFWYHTNIRKKLTLDYFLPVLLMPAYTGIPQPSPDEIAVKLRSLKEMLDQLNNFLADKDFLSGGCISAPDLVFASEVFALEIDPQFSSILDPYKNAVGWLDRLKSLPGYQDSHKVWNHLAQRILRSIPQPPSNSAWVADYCEKLKA